MARVLPSKFYRSLYYPLRLFFELLYNSMAWSYEIVARTVSLGLWPDWVRCVSSELPGPRVLEIGHGTGWLQAALLVSPHLFSIGIDKSRNMGKIAQRKLRGLDLPSRLTRAACQSLPLPSHYFDQAVATFPSEYLYDQQSLSELRRVLKPGGTLVVVPVAWITGTGWIHKLAAGLFHITGQAGEWDDRALQPFIQAGFSCTFEDRVVKFSRVMIVLARTEE